MSTWRDAVFGLAGAQLLGDRAFSVKQPLGLPAYEITGKDAAAVLGTALAIKMIAYVLIAPIASAYANRFSRRALLVGLDLPAHRGTEALSLSRLAYDLETLLSPARITRPAASGALL